MDAVTFITKLQKFIRDSYQNIGDAMISGTVDSMEKYKYMQGQANAYQTVIQEISRPVAILYLSNVSAGISNMRVISPRERLLSEASFTTCAGVMFRFAKNASLKSLFRGVNRDSLVSAVINAA